MSDKNVVGLAAEYTQSESDAGRVVGGYYGFRQIEQAFLTGFTANVLSEDLGIAIDRLQELARAAGWSEGFDKGWDASEAFHLARIIASDDSVFPLREVN